jgi:hypothetical protein
MHVNVIHEGEDIVREHVTVGPAGEVLSTRREMVTRCRKCHTIAGPTMGRWRWDPIFCPVQEHGGDAPNMVAIVFTPEQMRAIITFVDEHGGEYPVSDELATAVRYVRRAEVGLSDRTWRGGA